MKILIDFLCFPNPYSKHFKLKNINRKTNLNDCFFLFGNILSFVKKIFYQDIFSTIFDPLIGLKNIDSCLGNPYC